MLRTLKVTDSNGGIRTVFLEDLTTGNSVQDMLTIPGVYDTIESANPSIEFFVEKLTGTVGTYTISMFAVVVSEVTDVEDYTDMLSRMLTVPETAAKTLLTQYPEDVRDVLKSALEYIRYCESLSENSKLCVPKEALSRLSAEMTEKMSSVRKSYVLKGTDNQEIFQQAPDSEYGIVLPDLEVIHKNSDAVSALDILRVVAPYRKMEGQGVFSYRGIYHTPYYKVDMRLRGMVPSDINWISGYSTNDMLEVQPNERHMYNNLYTYICSDIARYVTQMASAIFFDTTVGSLISHLCQRKDSDLLHTLCADIAVKNSKEISCDISFGDIDSLLQSGWNIFEVKRVIESKLHIEEGYIKKLILARPNDRRVLDCDSIPFSLTFSDEEEQEFVELFIANGFLSIAMQRFLTDLCKKAYRVNWGHTGASLAIPGFVTKDQIEIMNQSLRDYLGDIQQGKVDNLSRHVALFTQSADDDEEDPDAVFLDDRGSTKDEAFSSFEYYVTNETMKKIEAGSLEPDFFSKRVSPAQTSEAAVVEYWRNINGEVNLDTFLSSALLKTADVSILITSFIKLMRWGSRKPKLLVIDNHREIRHVFDLNTGMKIDNTVIVDENDLIKVNGCDYSFEGVMYSSTNRTLASDRIVGFVLVKNYGTVRKKFIASWLDIGEIAKNNKKVIGDFLVVTPIKQGSDDSVIYVEEFEKQDYQVYVSDFNIDQGLKLKIQPQDLSPVSLFTTPGVLDSMGYLKSLKNDRIITTKDRQYDILHRYVDTINHFYTKYGDAAHSLQNTTELQGLAEKFCELFNSAGEKAEANTVMSQDTLKRLSFTNDSDKPKIEWDSTELSGKFYLIIDPEAKSILPSIEFSDGQLKKLASKARNRIILLMLQKDGKIIFCSKDITHNEVALFKQQKADGSIGWKIGFKTYTELAPLIDGLFAGKRLKVKGVPAVLHSSLSHLDMM